MDKWTNRWMGEWLDGWIAGDETGDRGSTKLLTNSILFPWESIEEFKMSSYEVILAWWMNNILKENKRV